MRKPVVCLQPAHCAPQQKPQKPDLSFQQSGLETVSFKGVFAQFAANRSPYGGRLNKHIVGMSAFSYQI